MVKIVEEDEEEEEVRTASSSHHNRRISPPASPDTPSSLSSDQTFHGFSPKPSPPHTSSHHPPDHHHQQPSHPAFVSRLIREDTAATITMTESGPVPGFAYEGGEDRGGGGEEGGEGKRKAPPPMSSSSVLRRSRRVIGARRAALGLRVCEFVACLISFSVMASDKNRGWALDSFDRYKEFRYSMSVNVIGFAYSVLQACSLAYQLTTGKQIMWSEMRCYFDFLVDQILAYLLVSASSSAATRVDDWISNWGQDKFPAVATASVAMSFLAFVAFALSSLISGYILCTHG